MATPPIQSVALPRIVDLDALDALREALLDALHAGPVEISAAAVERMSTNGLFMLLSAAETARRAGSELSIVKTSDAVRAAIARLGLAEAFAPLSRDR
ncbi:STAS domain-containing protein [Pelagibacterium lacus]|nr:STAS domain-containing protein [Pelagibacterium lacus]